jgi:uncharacterized protein (DUF1778 family)
MPATRRSAASEQQAHAHTKRSRFNARLLDEQKAVIERAAAITGQSVSQFIVSSAQRAAEETIREHEVISLSARDSKAVMEALLHPAPANEVLHRAMERHRELVGGE